MKNKKSKTGFTLIELLAVIIILGILMIIAIPSVTQYINNSRKSAYVDTAKEIVAGARNLVNHGKLEMYSTDTTYYITSACISTENGQKSPYGDFVEDETYVVVTYNGNGYHYFWTSRDETGQGVKSIVRSDRLSEDDIVSDIKAGEITPTIGIGNRNKIVVVDKDCVKGEEYAATRTIGENGGSIELVSNVCRRAQAGTLHTSTCNSQYGCAYNKYDIGETATYGQLGTQGQAPVVGDAFDCDVNGDGEFDSNKERFYFLRVDQNNNAVLIASFGYGPTELSSLSTETLDGIEVIRLTSESGSIESGSIESGSIESGSIESGSIEDNDDDPYYGGDDEEEPEDSFDYDELQNNGFLYNYDDVATSGPAKLVKYLPTASKWSNAGLIQQGTRDLKNYDGTVVGTVNYQDRVARLLSVDDLVNCTLSRTEAGHKIIYTGCDFLYDGMDLTSSDIFDSYWMETVNASGNTAGTISAYYQNGVEFSAISKNDYNTRYKIRPVITINMGSLNY